MHLKSDLSRITIDLPKEDHKRLKAVSAVLGKSMRELVIESIEEYLQRTKFPNEETTRAMKSIEQGRDLVKAKNAEDLFKKLGI